MNDRTMLLVDYEAVITVWQGAEGGKLRDADSREGIDKYLKRNPGLSFVAEHEGQINGTVMAGHDGKPGYVQHLAVVSAHRCQGVATELVARCLAALRREGIIKSHIHVLANNALAKAYWSNRGWQLRTDIEVYSTINGGSDNT